MATDIGAKIGIDGEAAFKSSISAINSQLKNLGSEMKSVVSAFSGMENSEEAVAAKGDVLKRSIQASADKIELLRGQSERAKAKLSSLAESLEKSKKEFGENSEQALKAQNAYNRQVTAVNNLESQINRTNAEMKRMEREMDSLGNETDNLSDDFDKADAKSCRFWSNLEANVLGQAIVGGVKAIASAVKGMAGDFIESAAAVKAEASQFEQTFGDMGGEASAAIGRVAKSSGILETRLNTLGAQIFAFARSSGGNATQSMNLMEKALQAAADGAAYYDRSLEETTESLQSFLKGNFSNDAALGLSCTETTRNAEAMELFGKKYNELSEIQKQETLLQMVLDAQELSGAMGQAAREADGWENVQGNLNEAWRQFQANVGLPFLESMVPVIQEITEKLTEMTEGMDWQSFSASITGFISAMIDNGPEILSAITGIGAGFMAWNVAQMIMGVSAAIKGQQMATTAAAGAQRAFNLVMNANPAVLVATLIAGLVAALVTFIATNEEARAKLVAAWDAIKNGVGGAIESLKALAEDLKAKFQSVIEWFLGIPSQMKEIGGNLITGLWNGINDKVAWLKGKVEGVVDKIKSWFTGSEGFDTHSPSKWSEKIGGWVMDGLGIGVENGTDAILPVIKTTANRIGDVLESELAKTNAEIEAMQKKANEEQAAKELKQYRDSLAAKQKELAKAEKKNKQKILDEIAKIEADWNEKQVQAARNAEKEKLQKRISALQEFQKEYESAISAVESKQSSLQDKLSDYGSLFERVKTEEGNELFQLGDLDAEIKKIQKYSKAIDDMRKKGLSDGLMGEISAMSVDDALDYMDKLSRMSKTKLNEYIQKYEEKQRLAAEAAEKFYQSEFTALEQNYTEKLPQALGGVKEQLYQVGAQAAQSFAEGMAGNSEGGVSGAISAAVADAKAATQEGDMQRIVSGMQEQEPILTGYIQEMQKRMLEMLASSQGDYINVGELMMDGLSQGIRNGQSGVVNAVAEVIAAAVRRAKNDLDINSPSKVFFGFGDYSMQGYEQGVKNRLKSVVKTMQESMAMIQRVPQPAAAGIGGNNNSRSYTYGDIYVHVDSIKSEREAKTVAREIEFLRRQQDKGKGGS